MLVPARFEEQVVEARDDRLRVLIVGAGIAGVTIAQLLRSQGLSPVLVERSSTGAARGYMLGLMPLADAPLRSLKAWPEYCENSVAMHRYQLRSSRDRVVRTYSLDAVLGEYGRYGGIERSQLIQVLSDGGVPATLDAKVMAITQNSDGAAVTVRTGEHDVTARFDLVIAADGANSSMRGLILRPGEVQTCDTGWGGWVAWAESGSADADLYAETWGRGFFIGRYPVRGRIGVFVGGPRDRTAAGVTPFLSHVRARLNQIDPMTSKVFSAIGEADHPYQWQFVDTRSSRWAVDRVVLLGDAAAGFLPTAGIGAAMAMESAAVLAANLLEVSAVDVPQALREYEAQQRPRVLAAHENSRQLARLMFRDGRVVCALRDVALRAATLKMALGPIIRLHRSAPLIAR